MCLVDNASHIYTVSVLKSLNKMWQSVSNIRVACYRFSGPDLFLNLLGTDIIDENKNLSLEKIKKLSNLNIDSNVLAIKTLWDKPFDINLIEYSINIISDETISIDSETKEYLTNEFMSVVNSDNDPIIKHFLLDILFFPIIKNIPERSDVLRVLDLYFLNALGFLDHPILYHRSYSKSILAVMDNAENGLIDLFTEKVFIYLINHFDAVCILGNYALTIYHSKIELARIKIKEDIHLRKSIKLEETFVSLFSSSIITIKSLMSMFDWKRDKAARLLARLTNLELFIENKVGKDKVFLNNVIMSAFLEVNKNDKVKELRKLLEKT